MIPSYRDKINIPAPQPIESKDSKSLEESLKLEQRIKQLNEQVEYLTRENQRLKSDIESIKYKINKG
jgi:predicted RNase H-like nuclease (RuvC/YqgF family)